MQNIMNKFYTAYDPDADLSAEYEQERECYRKTWSVGTKNNGYPVMCGDKIMKLCCTKQHAKDVAYTHNTNILLGIDDTPYYLKPIEFSSTIDDVRSLYKDLYHTHWR